jgi:DNA-binding NarL/FixJ family response regulator
VLVANSVAQRQLPRAVELGLASLLIRQESDFARIVNAIVAVDAGRARLPETCVRTLLDQMRAVGQEMVARCGTGLAAREIEVLRLLSDGMGTSEVATKLNYSERTVKNIVHGVLDRFQLRNRTHAVAFALRRGVL